MASRRLYLVGSTGGFTLGGFLLNRFADTGQFSVAAWSFLVQAISNILFVQVIRSGLGQGIVASSMIQVLFIAGLCAVVFKESFSTAPYVGVVLAAFGIFFSFGHSLKGC